MPEGADVMVRGETAAAGTDEGVGLTQTTDKLSAV